MSPGQHWQPLLPPTYHPPLPVVAFSSAALLEPRQPSQGGRPFWIGQKRRLPRRSLQTWLSSVGQHAPTLTQTLRSLHRLQPWAEHTRKSEDVNKFCKRRSEWIRPIIWPHGQPKHSSNNFVGSQVFPCRTPDAFSTAFSATPEWKVQLFNVKCWNLLQTSKESKGSIRPLYTLGHTLLPPLHLRRRLVGERSVSTVTCLKYGIYHQD